MKRTLKKLENCKTEINIAFEAKEWKEAREQAFKKLAKNIEIKGFRKGNAPEHLIKSRIDEAQMMHEAIDILLPKAYSEAITEEKIEPFSRPSVNVTKMSDTECEIVITVVTRPEVVLGEYKHLKIGHTTTTVEPAEIAEEIAKRLTDSAELVLKEDKAASGDTVVMDFEGFTDGKAFEGGKGENYSLELGSNTFIPGFEEQLIGAKAEQELEVNVVFPKEYPAANLAGKSSIFKVKVHEVKSKKIPELNDEAVEEMAIKDVKTVADFRKFVTEDLSKKKSQEEMNRYFEALLTAIRETSKIDLPQEIIDDEVAAMLENLKKQVEKNGLTLEQYYEMSNSKETDVKAKMAVEAERNIKNFFILEKVGQVEELEVTDAILELEIAKMAEQYGMEIEKIKEVVLKDKERFVENIKREHINQFLLRNND